MLIKNGRIHDGLGNVKEADLRLADGLIQEIGLGLTAMEGEEVFDAPAHNFIFATLNCYGLIGLLLLMAMVVAMLRQIHFFRFKDKATLYARLLFTLALCMYFGEGMVQATVYDMLVMPVMFTVFAAFSLSLQQTDTERN